MFDTGKPVEAIAMRIPDDLLMDEIKTPKKKRKKDVGESSEPKKKFKIKTKKPNPVALIPTTAELEKNHMTATEQTRSLETREHKKKTPIVAPPRSHRIDLSLDKRAKHLMRVVARVTKYRNNMFKTMEKNFVHRRNVENLCVKIVESLDKEVPSMVVERTDQDVKANLCLMVQEEMQNEITSVKDELSSMVSQEIVATTPQKIKEFLWHYMQNHAITLQPPDLFYLKNANTEARKYALSLHNIHATAFSEDELEELLTRWWVKCLKCLMWKHDYPFNIGNNLGQNVLKKKQRIEISDPNYEAFYDDHVKEISSGSTTTHSDSSLYDSFIFDLSINPFPPVDRSDFYEFIDELAHIISQPEYDCFCFKNEPNAGDFTMDVVEDTFPTREPRVHNTLPTHPTLQRNLDFILSSESLFTYVVWIFLPFLSYSVAPQYLLSFGNEDTIFDSDISSYHISSFLLDVSHRSGTFIKINVYPKHLNGSPIEILFSSCTPMDQ
uniref:Integrase, catalytic region, zinc finger, CCHC-type, peptidase aspartic, catalytic n=1 Tax=Tanacetum cinerariifolium TaxID=118510 RepID=A0A6L2N8P0_TANCI|nr:hypothetical protein [Tanacetum cinerariifolium]